MIEHKVMSKSRKSDVDRAIQARTSYRSTRTFRDDMTIDPCLGCSRIYHRIFFYNTAITSLLMMSYSLGGNTLITNVTLLAVPIAIRLHFFYSVAIRSSFRVCACPTVSLILVRVLFNTSIILELVSIFRTQGNLIWTCDASTARTIWVTRFRMTENTAHICVSGNRKRFNVKDALHFQPKMKIQWEFWILSFGIKIFKKNPVYQRCQERLSCVIIMPKGY